MELLHSLDRDRISEVQTARDALQGDPGCDMALGGGGGGVVATPLRHTPNCGKSRDRDVATPWSATGGGRFRNASSAFQFGPLKVHLKKSRP